MEENRFYILGAKKIAGELNKEESLELDAILVRNPVYRSIYQELEHSMLVTSTDSFSASEENDILQNLREKLAAIDPGFSPGNPEPNSTSITHPRPVFNRFKKTILVFVLIAACGLAAFVYYNDRPAAKKGSAENNIVTRPGSKTQISLPDGSLVYLNADSKLTYPDNFLGDTREVTLEGEAFFDVKENRSRPFIIHSKAMDIQVLGTAFNVRAYPSETISEAALIRGSIEISLKNRTNDKILLQSKEKITVSDLEAKNPKGPTAKQPLSKPLVSIEKLVTDEKDNGIDEIAWTNNKLVFTDESFESLAGILGRWYGRTILIRGERLKTARFTGKFHNENITQVLTALQLTNPFNYKFDKDVILVW